MLILPVGPPGSGKSYLVKALVLNGFDPDGIVSPDEYRRILTGDRSRQDQNKSVFHICHKIANIRLSMGLSVYFDATNLNILACVAKAGLQARVQGMPHTLFYQFDHGRSRMIPIKDVVVVRFDVDANMLRSRNETRRLNHKNAVPDDVLERMIQQYESVAAGFKNYPGQIITYEEALQWAAAGRFK